MRINHKSLALFFSGGFLSLTALGQSIHHDCSGVKLSPTQILVSHDEPLCSAAFETPACERIPRSTADAIFIGTVMSLEKSEGLAIVNGECSPISFETAVVRVKEVFTGNPTNTVTIQSGTVNGYYFHRKETALIYAQRNADGTYSVSGCGGTKSMTEWYTHGPRENPLAKEDIAYLHARGSLSPTSRIFGNVEVVLPEGMSHMNPAFGFRGQTVILSGIESRRMTTTRSGAFSFDNLSPGEYSVLVDSLKPIASLNGSTVTVPARGCAKVDFYIESADDYRNVIASFKKASAKKP